MRVQIDTNVLANLLRDSNPCKSLSENEILAELSESRMSYEGGEGEELSKVISDIGEKYGLRIRRDKYVQKNPLSMEEIDEEIQAYRKGLV